MPPTGHRRRGAGRSGWPRRTRRCTRVPRAEVVAGVAVLACGDDVRPARRSATSGRRWKFTKPGPASSTRSTCAGGAAVSCSTSAVASSRGGRPACFAAPSATFDDQSPCSRRAGRLELHRRGRVDADGREGVAHGLFETFSDHGWSSDRFSWIASMRSTREPGSAAPDDRRPRAPCCPASANPM